MLEPKTVYVKPDATLEKKAGKEIPQDKVTFEGKVDGFELTKARESAIINLDEIHAGLVKKIMRCSTKRADAILKELHSEGKIKTEAERYNELYPVSDEPEPEKVVEAKPADPSVIDMGLSGTITGKLIAAGVNNASDLTAMTEAEVLAIDGIGASSVAAIVTALGKLGLALKAE